MALAADLREQTDAITMSLRAYLLTLPSKTFFHLLSRVFIN